MARATNRSSGPSAPCRRASAASRRSRFDAKSSRHATSCHRATCLASAAAGKGLRANAMTAATANAWRRASAQFASRKNACASFDAASASGPEPLACSHKYSGFRSRRGCASHGGGASIFIGVTGRGSWPQKRSGSAGSVRRSADGLRGFCDGRRRRDGDDVVAPRGDDVVDDACSDSVVGSEASVVASSAAPQKSGGGAGAAAAGAS